MNASFEFVDVEETDIIVVVVVEDIAVVVVVVGVVEMT